MRKNYIQGLFMALMIPFYAFCSGKSGSFELNNMSSEETKNPIEYEVFSSSQSLIDFQKKIFYRYVSKDDINSAVRVAKEISNKLQIPSEKALHLLGVDTKFLDELDLSFLDEITE